MDRDSILLRTIVDELEDLANEEGFEGFEREPVEELLVPEPVDLDKIRAHFKAAGADGELAEAAAEVVAETLEVEGVPMTGAPPQGAGESGEDGEGDEDDPFEQPTMVASNEMLAMASKLKAEEQEKQAPDKAPGGKRQKKRKAARDKKRAQKKATGSTPPEEAEATEAPAAADAKLDEASLFQGVEDETPAREAPIATEADGRVVTAEHDFPADQVAAAERGETDEGDERDDGEAATPATDEDQAAAADGDEAPADDAAEEDGGESAADDDDGDEAAVDDDDARKAPDRDGGFPDLPTNPGVEADGFDGEDETERSRAKERLEQEITRALEDEGDLPDDVDITAALMTLAPDVERLEPESALSLAPLDDYLAKAGASAEARARVLKALHAKADDVGLALELPGAGDAESSFFEQPAGEEQEVEADAIVEDEVAPEPPSDFVPADVSSAGVDAGALPSHSTGGRFKWVAVLVIGFAGLIGYLAFAGSGGGTRIGICKLTVEKAGELLCVVDRPVFKQLSLEGRDQQMELVRAEAKRRGLADVNFVDDDGVNLLADDKADGQADAKAPAPEAPADDEASGADENGSGAKEPSGDAPAGAQEG